MSNKLNKGCEKSHPLKNKTLIKEIMKATDYSTYTNEELIKELELMEISYEADRQMGGYNFDSYLAEAYSPMQDRLYDEIERRGLVEDSMPY